MNHNDSLMSSNKSKLDVKYSSLELKYKIMAYHESNLLNVMRTNLQRLLVVPSENLAFNGKMCRVYGHNVKYESPSSVDDCSKMTEPNSSNSTNPDDKNSMCDDFKFDVLCDIKKETDISASKGIFGKTLTNKSLSQLTNETKQGTSLFRDVCDKSFSQKSNLKSHMSTHTGGKAFSCQVCGKSYSQKGNLNSHMSTHTGEKAFSCDVCGKSFSGKCNLKSHVYPHRRKNIPVLYPLGVLRGDLSDIINK